MMVARFPSKVVDVIRRLQLPFIVLAIIGAIELTVGIVGELLGWWNDFGELISVSGLAQLAVGVVVTWAFGASRVQVRKVLEELGLLRPMNERLGRVAAKLERLEPMDQKLERLEPMDQKLERLEPMDRKLDAMVGEQQTTNALLREIRDRLPPPSGAA